MREISQPNGVLRAEDAFEGGNEGVQASRGALVLFHDDRRGHGYVAKRSRVVAGSSSCPGRRASWRRR